MLINIEVDNRNQVFLFDTGSTLSAITDTTSIENFYKKTKGSFGFIKGADRKITARSTITSKVNSELFFSESKIFANTRQSEIKCQKNEIYKGIIGLDAVFRGEEAMLIDFSNSKLCNIKPDDKSSHISNGYSKIKSECKSNKIYVFLTIEGKEVRFKLDTGFYGDIIMPYTEQIDFSKYNSLTYEGCLMKTINSITYGEESFYENIMISNGNININTKVHVSKTVKAQNIGLNFMKGFDWIIDYKNNEVYIKRNHIGVKGNFDDTKKEYFTFEKDGKLVISLKLKNANKHNLGDEIISVNNQKITPDNICEMQNLLNRTIDWETLKIEIKVANNS